MWFGLQQGFRVTLKIGSIIFSRFIRRISGNIGAGATQNPSRRVQICQIPHGRTIMKSASLIAAALLISDVAHAADIKVLSTQATEEAYKELVAQFEKGSGHKVATIFTGTLDANKRLAAGESYDLIIMSASSIEEHIKGSKIAAGSRVDL